MKKTLFILVLITTFSFSLIAQTNELIQLQNKVTALESTNLKLNNQLRASQKAINDLTKELMIANQNVKKLQDEFATLQISTNEYTASFNDRIAKTQSESEQQFNILDKSVSNSTLFWIIAFVVVAFVTLLLNWQLKSRLAKEKKEITNNIKTGNELIRDEFAGTITKNSDELRATFNSEIKDVKENTNKLAKATDDIRGEFKTNLKLATDAFTEQKNNLELQIKKLIEEGKKTVKPATEL